MALLISFVLMLLQGLLGASSMLGATQQERLSGLQAAASQAFEGAEAALMAGEAGTASTAPCTYCLPPPEAARVRNAGVQAGVDSSGLPWRAAAEGFYLIQNLGSTTRARGMPEGVTVTVYRITAVGRQGATRSVLESLYAHPLEPADAVAGRIGWREIH